jgi:3-oxoacyl-[acyl-carrier protein] reductase
MTVSYDFSGRTAIVTGGAKGIGRRIARRLAEAGARVAIWDVAEPEQDGALFQHVDVTRADQIEKALSRLVEETSGLDILISNAGIVGTSRSVEAFDPQEWRRIVEINLTGVFEVCRLAVPHLRRSRSGRIVTIASLAGKEGTPMLSAYSAAKAGVIAFTKSLGKELADASIRVNCIAPAAIETDLLQQMTPDVVDTMTPAPSSTSRAAARPTRPESKDVQRRVGRKSGPGFRLRGPSGPGSPTRQQEGWSIGSML